MTPLGERPSDFIPARITERARALQNREPTRDLYASTLRGRYYATQMASHRARVRDCRTSMQASVERHGNGESRKQRRRIAHIPQREMSEIPRVHARQFGRFNPRLLATVSGIRSRKLRTSGNSFRLSTQKRSSAISRDGHCSTAISCRERNQYQ